MCDVCERELDYTAAFCEICGAALCDECAPRLAFMGWAFCSRSHRDEFLCMEYARMLIMINSLVETFGIERAQHSKTIFVQLFNDGIARSVVEGAAAYGLLDSILKTVERWKDAAIDD